jgi:hypothetical protein
VLGCIQQLSPLSLRCLVALMVKGSKGIIAQILGETPKSETDF